jgi:hypothetical protein
MLRTTVLLSILLACAGCASPQVSHTKRTAIEQRLLSTAADAAVAQIEAPFLRGRTVFLDESRFESEDKGYVVSALRDHLNRQGAAIAANAADADVVVEVRCGAMATDGSELLIGVPKLPIPIPAVGTIQTPEVALVKQIAQSATAKVALFARDAKTGRHIASVRPHMARRYFDRWRVLFFITYNRTDLPKPSTETKRVGMARYE